MRQLDADSRQERDQAEQAIVKLGLDALPHLPAPESKALSAEQREILERRGVLSPEEIHRLASKTRQAMGAGEGRKAACHSDHVDDDKARRLQEEHAAGSGA